MSIRVTCEKCSHDFKVSDTLAGKRCKCPECDTVVQIPAFEHTRTSSHSSPKSRKASSTSKNNAKKRSTSVGLWLGVSIGGGIAIIAIIIAVIVWFPGQGSHRTNTVAPYSQPRPNPFQESSPSGPPPLDSTNAIENPEVMGWSGHSDDVWAIDLDQDATYLFTCAADSLVIQWNISTGEKVREYRGHSGRVICVQVTEDASQFFSGSEDNSVIHWNSKTGEQIRVLRGFEEGVTGMWLSPDNHRIYVGDLSNINVFDVKSGQIVHKIPVPIGWAMHFMVSRDEKTIAIASNAKAAMICRVENGELIREFRDFQSAVKCVYLFEDRPWLITGSDDNSAILWNRETGEKLREFSHSRLVNCVDVSKDGNTMIIGTWGEDGFLWDLSTGEQLQTLKGHTSDIRDARFSDDGKLIVTGSFDNTAILWNAETGEKIRRFGTPDDD